ncbi:MAG: hypothetical protein U0836_13040 [Pirellulales bacterium]
MKTKVLLLVSAVTLVSSAGCYDMAPPQLFNPGPTKYQQMQAQRFDPYPENDIAPDGGGGRPLGFQKPVAEPSRARWQLKNPFARRASQEGPM